MAVEIGKESHSIINVILRSCNIKLLAVCFDNVSDLAEVHLYVGVKLGTD